MKSIDASEVWRVLGATEAATSVLRGFLEDVRSSRSWGDILSAFDKLYQACVKRPYSALLINTARDIFSRFLEEAPRDPGEASRIIEPIVSRVFDNVRIMTEQASLIASKRISNNETIFTLSFSGTVLRTVENVLRRGDSVRIIVPESRPFGEGVEMAKALKRLGADVVLIVDSAIRSFIRRASRVVIGAEAISSNGAVINKIGTAILALTAKEARIRVFVVAGSYKIMPETVFGELIGSPEIGLPDIPEDLLSLGVSSSFPLFEAVPPEYIDAIITEKGLISPAAVPYIVRDVFGSWPPSVKRIDELYGEIRRTIEGAVK